MTPPLAEAVARLAEANRLATTAPTTALHPYLVDLRNKCLDEVADLVLLQRPPVPPAPADPRGERYDTLAKIAQANQFLNGADWVSLVMRYLRDYGRPVPAPNPVYDRLSKAAQNNPAFKVGENWADLAEKFLQNYGAPRAMLSPTRASVPIAVDKLREDLRYAAQCIRAGTAGSYEAQGLDEWAERFK
jgi:hypothetical protein